MNLYEHQSTFCPNMPIRGLLYLASIYQAYVTQNHYNLYGTRLIPLPAPQYVIFYNGQYRKMGFSQARAVDTACEYAIEHDILRNFLLKHRSEVKNLIRFFMMRNISGS